ncbi:IspD/TarI family cytidylyltransferase [Geodermatophilus sabuli]|uniref:2-C-methyl-D-erythritol 4-phosphate cytidylyltransferase n=1 Tax=Geodermatophilus sabuli TaxID=1564158 RepID=A0A285EL69_9ACTN|nr:IspD/TarI family cytidylyltransferase [Geodermatophilus sabuli]MBB3086896.1 2-C-methyl-D-erythritol 4-phosphate cytidylyltransferase [Geodermatophilus sabuli]SNX98731.1 2-C-methyl-D-erythritol 4-phosphate cytidylyltransferase [Geodermatophilus sabuli]
MAAQDAVAIVFAGGLGSRMVKAQLPKQFITIRDKPVLVHTLEHFQSHPEVGAIYLSCLTGYIEHAWDLVREFGVTKVRAIVAGGVTAQNSILNAVQAALADNVPEDATALVHDGVRPVINADLITRNIATARERGSAITAIPCFETIAMSLDEAQTVESVTQRDLMYVLQAPQTFPLGEVFQVNTRSLEDGLLGKFVDQAHLMRHYGAELHLVPGLRGNVKLTTDFDLLQFRLLVESGALSSVVGAELS